MIASGYQSSGLRQEVPAGLTSNMRGGDLVVSRTRRIIRPNGGSTVTGGSVLDFNITSSTEWLDTATTILHATLTVNAIADPSGALVPYPKAGWRSIIRGYNLQCKGQAMETSLDSGGLIAWNALRSRIYEGRDKLKAAGQLLGGGYDVINPTGAGTFLYNPTRIDGGKIKFEIAVPLNQIVNFFNLDRSYVPIFAIPLLLQMTVSQIGEAFVSPKGGVFGTGPGSYEYSNVYLASDFLQMDSSVDEKFRDMVMNSSVSFMYPSVFITQDGDVGADVNLKHNLNASNLDSVYFYPTRVSATTDSFYPACTDNIFDKTTMSNVKYNLYIDSRNVFSEPIGNCAEAFDELVKSTKNDNQQYLESAPYITAQGFINGIQKNTDVGSLEYYGDIAMNVLAVNLSRVLALQNASGINISLSGGRLSMQITGMNAANDRIGYMFFKHTRQLILSSDFLQVIQ